MTPEEKLAYAKSVLQSISRRRLRIPFFGDIDDSVAEARLALEVLGLEIPEEDNVTVTWVHKNSMVSCGKWGRHHSTAKKVFAMASILFAISVFPVHAASTGTVKILLMLSYNVPYKSAWFDVVHSTAEAALRVATDQERRKVWNVAGVTDTTHVYSLYEIPIDTTTHKIAATGSRLVPIPRLTIPAVK